MLSQTEVGSELEIHDFIQFSNDFFIPLVFFDVLFPEQVEDHRDLLFDHAVDVFDISCLNDGNGQHE